MIVDEHFSEIINLKNAMTCSVVEKYPRETNGAVGGNLGSTPVVCGGTLGNNTTDKCYAYIKSPSSIQGYGNLGFIFKKHGLILAEEQMINFWSFEVLGTLLLSHIQLC